MHESFANLFPESLHFPPYSLLWRRRRLYRVLLLLAGASARRSSSHHTLLLISYSLPASVLSSTSPPHHIVLRFCVRSGCKSFFGKMKTESQSSTFIHRYRVRMRSLIPSKWISFKSNDDVWQWYLWLERMMMRSKKEVAEKNRVSHHHRYCKWWMQWNIFSFRKESTFLSLRSTFPIDQLGEAR